ncbi:RES domain-containing protein [Clostridium sp. LIBA-8841]|uniref:RES domain-containing protein n=1 Tax=Clostridium sp. LIBA-8841 TaxID=2987530 RepID=UPI002AC4CC3B|nr:RES domain-containing protein [Clostridium sp. LIBA-8841]MDZ5254805.1 RES domain-containing protein [Clostridium sp. LIBA-8841]
MRCLNCSNLINSIDNLLISFNPDKYGLSKNESNKILKCNSCNEDILYGDYYLDEEYSEVDDIKEDLCYEVAKAIEKNIKSCSNCGHGNRMKDFQASLYTYFKEDNEYEELWDKYNVSTELQELICDNSLIDEEYYYLIIDNIRCPKCGNGGGAYSKDTMDYEKFDKYSEVYTRRDIELFDEKFYGDYPEIKKYLKLVDETITVDELEKFRDEYMKNPIFIFNNKVFKIIYSKLEETYRKKQIILLYSSKRLFRTRLNKTGQIYTKESMWNPPSGKPNQGRYNFHGKSVLYCSNNIEILKKEIKANKDEEYNFAVLRLLKPMNLLPVDLIFDDFDGFINDNSVDDNCLKKKYIITNIIQMICEQIGYNGVAYKSVKDNRYVNYALFNFEKNKDIEIIKVFKESFINKEKVKSSIFDDDNELEKMIKEYYQQKSKIENNDSN